MDPGHTRLFLLPLLWRQEEATYLRIHVLDAQPCTSTGRGPPTLAAAERQRQYHARKKLEEGSPEHARRAARMRQYRAQRRESCQYYRAKEAERKRQYRARKKLEAQLQQPAVKRVRRTEDKLRKDAERKRRYRARKKAEAQLGGVGESEKAEAAQGKRPYRPRNKLSGEHGLPVSSSGLPATPVQPALKEGHAHAQTQCTRWLSASCTQAAILSKTRTVGVQT